MEELLKIALIGNRTVGGFLYPLSINVYCSSHGGLYVLDGCWFVCFGEVILCIDAGDEVTMRLREWEAYTES